MQAAINQTIDFLQNFQLEMPSKSESTGYKSENKGEISSDSKKSFSQMVDDAKKISEKAENVSAKEKLTASDKSVEVQEKPEKQIPENKVKISDLKNGKTGIHFKEIKSETKSDEKVQNNSVKNEKIRPDSSQKNVQFHEKTKENSADDEKLKLKLVKKDIQEEKNLDNNVFDEKSVVLNQDSISELKNEMSFEKESSDDDEKFILGNIKSKEKTFALDKDGKIKVTDLRTENVEKSSESKKLEIKDAKFDGKNNIEMNVELSSQNVTSNILSSDSQTASADGSNFQAMLQNQIQENAGELVKAGNIVLKDNNVGQIKLILHPEQLGNVKIDLQVKDNNISGRIIVQTQEAFEAFKQSAENLREAFVAGGYETAGFDLSFAGQNNGQNEQTPNQDNQSRNFYRAFAYEGSVTDDYNDFEEISEISYTNSVNIVA